MRIPFDSQIHQPPPKKDWMSELIDRMPVKPATPVDHQIVNSADRFERLKGIE